MRVGVQRGGLEGMRTKMLMKLTDLKVNQEQVHCVTGVWCLPSLSQYPSPKDTDVPDKEKNLHLLKNNP